VQFSTLFLISLFSVAIALTGCMGSSNTSAGSGSTKPSTETPSDNAENTDENEDSSDNLDNGPIIDDNNPLIPPTDPKDPTDPNNPGTPNTPKADLTQCDHVPTSQVEPYTLGNNSEAATYDISQYDKVEPVEGDTLAGTWVIINKKSVDLGGSYDITQIWEKSFFIIRATSSNELEIANCSGNNGFSPIEYIGENNVLNQAHLTPTYGAVSLSVSSNSELLEVKPSGVDEQIFNSNQAKAIKISSSVSSLTSGNNSITIADDQYGLDDVWCLNQSRKVTFIQKQENQCTTTAPSQSFESLTAYSDTADINIATLYSTDFSGAIISASNSTSSNFVIGANSLEDLGIDSNDAPNLTISFTKPTEAFNNTSYVLSSHTDGINFDAAVRAEISINISIPTTP